ncbi:hypothetical protein GCM10027592_29050 [Spirosoma flavus]
MQIYVQGHNMSSDRAYFFMPSKDIIENLNQEFILSPKNQRLRDVFEALKAKRKAEPGKKKYTQQEFAQSIKSTQAHISKVFSGEKPIGEIIDEKVIRLLGVKKLWWETGEGEMFEKDPGRPIRLSEVNLENPGQPRKTIEAIPLDFVDETDVTTNSQGTEFRDLKNGYVLATIEFVPEYAYASYPHGWRDPEWLDKLPKHSIILPKRDHNRYRSFEVSGDSMDDDSKQSISNRDTVTGRLIEPDNWNSKTFITVGKDYIISGPDGVVIKRIARYDVVNGTLTLTSLNPDKSAFPDYDVSLQEVFEVYRVVKVEQNR